VELRLDTEEFLLFVFFNGGDADAGPAGDDFFDILAGDDARGGVVELVALAESAEVFFFLALFL